MKTHVSASTIRVLVTFSMVNFVFPPLPAILPMALDKWSPFRGLTVKPNHVKLFKHRPEGSDAEQSYVLPGQKVLITVSPSVMSKLSRKSSSNRIRANASWKERVWQSGHKQNSLKLIGSRTTLNITFIIIIINNNSNIITQHSEIFLLMYLLQPGILKQMPLQSLQLL